MALKTVVGALATAIQGLPSSPTTLPDEFRATHQIAAGDVNYQLELHQIAEIEEASSEVKRAVGRIIVRMWARPALLSIYTRVTMLDDQESLYSPAWWRAISGIYNVTAPREEERPVLLGPVVRYAVRVEAHVNL